MSIRRCWRAGPPAIALLTLTLLTGGATAVAPGRATDQVTPQTHRAPPCSRGLVALTFDDGPQSSTTRPVMRILSRRNVPATFFVIGERVPGEGGLLRTMRRRGFRIANHTFGHENLTRLSNTRIRSTLRHTSRAIRHSGARGSRLMRPPYGAIDDRVERVVRGLGMTPVLWTVDSRDWDGRSARRIVASVLGQLDPGRNIVLLHDGVANSDQTVTALPRLIRKIRGHGYCLAALDRHGRVKPPVPTARVAGDAVRERDRRHPVYLRFAVRLSKPTSRPVSVRVRTRQGSAVAGRDFQARRFRLRFPVGVTRRTVRVKVLGNARAEPLERMRLVLSHPHRMRVADAKAPGTIRDDD